MLLVVSSTQKPVRGYEKKMSWIQNEWQPVPWLTRPEGNELWQEPILVIIFFPQRSFLWNVQQTTNELDMLDSKIELASKEEYLHFAISVSGWKYCWKDYSWNYLFHQMIFFCERANMKCWIQRSVCIKRHKINCNCILQCT